MDGKSVEIPIRLARQQDDDEKRNKKDAESRQTVWQVHIDA
jgi:hypothetical protein